MKKIAIIVFTIITNLGYTQNNSELSEDENFINYLKQELLFYKNIENNEIEILKNINIDHEISKDEMIIFCEIVNMTEDEFIKHNTIQSERYFTFYNKFGLEKIIGKNLEKYFENEIISYQNNNTEITEKLNPGKNCYKKYNAQVVMNFGTALTASYGCYSLIAPPLVGGCLTGVVIANAAANYSAYLDYQDCMQN
jgi:hypothetical protein